MPTWDHAFAGGGIAACHLALRLVRGELGSVLLVDRTTHDPRTFAFWTDQSSELDDLVEHRWGALRVVGEGQELVRPLGRWTYALVRAETLRLWAHQAIERAGGLILRAEVERIEDGRDSAAIVAGGERYEARWVYDSRQDRPMPPMRQGFHGWWIETEHDAFDPALATLMDFRTAQDAGGLRFFHVLPTTARRALVTGVSLAPEPLSVGLEAYLRESLGLQRWKVTAVERGVTALDPAPAPRRRGERVLAIGLTGGLLKPSTGYAFTRMQRDAGQIVASLREDGHPHGARPSSWGWRLLDDMLLRVIARHGPETERVFVALFARNPIARVLRFLDERATLGEVAMLVLTLPAWRWFLWAALAVLLGAGAKRHISSVQGRTP
jgi:lycopene beta-cyclase